MRMPRPGPGERLAPDDLGRQAELLADPADLVLEQRAQRLDQLELQVVGQAADVVVALDVRGARCRRRTRRRPGRACPAPGTRRLTVRPASATTSRGRLLEDPDELAADDLALLLGVGDPGQRGQEPLLRRRRPSARTPVAATKSRSTCSASPARSRPWSTKTQVSWSPIARCTSAAATAESTPPDRPQIDPLVADLRADRGDLARR